MRNVEIVWAIRHSTIAASYFDKQAATLFLPRLNVGRSEETPKPEASRVRYTINNNKDQPTTVDEDPSTSGGCALGPFWLSRLDQKVSNKNGETSKVSIIYLNTLKFID